MELLNQNSLAGTIDALDDVFFHKKALSGTDRTRIAEWIASRHGQPRSYANMFAPTEEDFASAVRMYSGDLIASRVGKAHILGEEACRLLILLDVRTPSVQKALREASEGMMKAVAYVKSVVRTSGMYCCGRCSCSYWRHLAAGGLSVTVRQTPSFFECKFV
jgi:hypothetical protein